MALLHRRSSSMPLFLQSMTNTMINLSYILSVVPQNLARRCCQSSWTTFLIFCYVSITTNQCHNKRDIKLIIGYWLDNQTRVIATILVRNIKYVMRQVPKRGKYTRLLGLTAWEFIPSDDIRTKLSCIE